MNVPRNVLRFEALLYASLMLDALSVAFQDRTPPPGVTEEMVTSVTMFNGGMILLYLYFVWLAARKRMSWPRWVLAVALVLSVIQIILVINQQGLELDSSVAIVSCVLTSIGLYSSFTGDAQGWFDA